MIQTLYRCWLIARSGAESEDGDKAESSAAEMSKIEGELNEVPCRSLDDIAVKLIVSRETDVPDLVRSVINDIQKMSQMAAE